VDRVEDSGQSDLMKKMNRRREAIQGKKDKPLSNDFQVVATPETRAPVHVADAAQRESHKASAATYLGDIQKGGFNLRPTTQQTYKPKVEESNLAKNTEKAKARMETSNKDKVKQGGGRQPSDIKMRAPRT
jgi:tRNA(Ile2) C34 agmatinyltransferase TiaS